MTVARADPFGELHKVRRMHFLMKHGPFARFRNRQQVACEAHFDGVQHVHARDMGFRGELVGHCIKQKAHDGGILLLKS